MKFLSCLLAFCCCTALSQSPFFDYKRYLFGSPPTLGLSIQSIDTTTGNVTINGGVSGGPSSLTWRWGDASVTSGFFPQSHTYTDHSKNYIVNVIANYSGGVKDSSEILVRFVAPVITPIAIPDSYAVHIPEVKPGLGTRLYPVPPQLTAFNNSFFTSTPRAAIEYVLSVCAVIENDFANHDAYLYNGKFEQFILRDSAAGGAYSLWFTDPVSFGSGDSFFQGTIGYSSFFHEMGHNVTLNTPANYYYGGRIDGNANAIFSEAMANIFQHAAAYEIVNNHQSYGLGDDLTFDIKQSAISSVSLIRTTYDQYISGGKTFASWNDPGSPSDETFKTFMTIAYKFLEHAENSGLGYRNPLQHMMKLLDGFNPDWLQRYDPQNNTASADTFRATLMTAAVSFAFLQDLRSEFLSLNFPISDAIYDELYNSPPAISAIAGTHGSVTPPGTTLLTTDQNQSFIISPDVGYHLDSLFVDDVHVDSTTSFTFMNVTSYHTIRAVFGINTYTIAAASGANGSISPSGSVGVSFGANKKFTVTADAGYHKDSIIVDDVNVLDSTTSYTFTNIAADHTIRAVFAQNIPVITATAGSHGFISPAGATTISFGTNQRFALSPDTGYHIDSLLVDGVHIPDSTTSYTFINVITNHTIRAVFRANASTIAASSGANGSISPSGDVNVDYGTDKTFSFSPIAGYHVDSLFVDGSHVPDSTTSYTFTNVITNHAIHVTFSETQIHVVVSVRAGWNMVSVPMRLTDYRKTAVYPTATSAAFAYEEEYVIKDTLVHGRGYWAKFATGAGVSMLGYTRTTDTIDVTTGWNLVGSVSYSMPTSSIGSVPGGLVTSNFFGYDGSYAITDTIEPGKACWVNVSGNGSLILSSSANVPSSNRIKIISDGELPPSPPARETSNLKPETPRVFTLAQNYPNPFNPKTVFSFQLPVSSYVTLKVIDVVGREVTTIVNEDLPPGVYSKTWDASSVPSGVYFYRIMAGNFTETKKLLLVK